MADKSKITIISKISPELSSNITVDNIVYHVQTEDMGRKTCALISSIYLKGEVVHRTKSNYSHIAKLKDSDSKLKNLMERQHQSVISTFLDTQSKKEKRKSDYFEEVKQLLRRGNPRSALNTLRNSLDKFPEDPFLMSYYGCLIAIVENNPAEGVRICEDAIKALNRSMPFGIEFFYPVFYLNLGRAYLKQENKTAAIESFTEGLRHDHENRDLLWEMKKLGSRRKPAVPFLRRSNPINKYIGMILDGGKKQKPQPG